eukprot:g2319.t1
MVRVLMVAEKPSIADAIANALDEKGEKRTSKRAGVPIHIFPASFRGEGASVVVTSVRGHLFSTDFPTEYQNRAATDPRTLFKAPVLKIPTSAGLVRSLQQLGSGIDHLVLWLDCDREGENICFEVIRVVKPGMRRNRDNRNIWRARFSAITPKDIRCAMRSLERPNENESLSVDARQELDLKVGVAWTRFQTRYFQARYGKRCSRLVSYGPCQTPTLGFCVARHDRIQQFKSERFWRIESSVRLESTGDSGAATEIPAVAGNPNAPCLRLSWRRNRLFDENATRAILDTVLESKFAVVRTLTLKRGSKSPPVALNTVAMLKIASRALRIGPKDTMRTAEDLYLRGLISYPRTETSQYPKHFDILGTLEAQQRHPTYGAYAKKCAERWRCPSSSFKARRRGIDAGDHPPITPVGACGDSHLGSRERRLYDMIVRHFLASVSPDCEFMRSEALFVCGHETFEAHGIEIVEPGFTEILPKSSPASDANPPLPKSIERGQRLALRAHIVEGATKPPSHIAEHELVSLMERHAVGTDASMATHISNIQSRKFVTVGPGRTLVPTEMGLTLVHGFLRIDPELVLPRVRAAIENECSRIARGEAKADEVLEYALEIFARKYDHFVDNIGRMDSLFSMHYAPQQQVDGIDKLFDGKLVVGSDAPPMSRCGVCQTYMKYISLPPHRLFCRTCDVTYALPTFGVVSSSPGKYCPLDHFELVVHASGESKKTRLCPRCYNDPPFEDIRGGMTCDSCPHPTCESSYKQRVICRCPSSARVSVSAETAALGNSDRKKKCKGSLVLSRDRERGLSSAGSKKRNPKKWSLRCNMCGLTVTVHRVRNVKIASRKRCDACASAIIRVEFDARLLEKQRPELAVALKSLRSSKEGKDASGWENYSGCIVCDDLLNAQTTVRHGL